ncbi:MAG: hypothetical protein Ct9H300mP21_06080 [Pseudomonadota bacterium]|nr:MAG: hypothetical protein Ct9H300mP21_06080 [Pseudomonadota bacterium]
MTVLFGVRKPYDVSDHGKCFFFRYNDWFKGSYLYGSTNRKISGERGGDGKPFKVGGSVWRYVFHKKKVFPGWYLPCNGILSRVWPI